MAQVSYGTITINDITDINDVYLEYALALSGANVTNNYTFNNLGEISWSTTYPTWQSGYQIWIREVQEKEGIQQKEYKTPYLDTAVNQINNNYINLNDRIKKIWSNSTGSYMASGINNNDVNENNVSTYGYNSKSTTTGISFNYNAIPLIEMGILDSGNFSGIKLYSPILTNSTISSSRLDATLTSWGLKLVRGGIDAGSYNSTASDEDQHFVYLSSEDYGIGTKIGDSASDKTDWRQIIGNKFGVDKAGNLYAAGAHIDGNIIARSLQIGGAEGYDGVAAINITGYSIEIEVVDIADSTNTKKLIPHLLRNGENADIEVTDKTDFIWYVNNSNINNGIPGDSVDGSIIGEYGNSYKVIYDFNDGVVEGGTATRTLIVDPTKYITRISDTGITIHPEMLTEQSSWIQLDGNGMELFNSSNESIARYGEKVTIGKQDKARLQISDSDIQIVDAYTRELFNVTAYGVEDTTGTSQMTFTANGTDTDFDTGRAIVKIKNATINGSLKEEGTDYTYGTNYIRFKVAPQQGSIIQVSYSGYSNSSEIYYTLGLRDDRKQRGQFSVAEGRLCVASGDSSHAEGSSAKATGNYSHAEGSSTASGVRSHAEGYSVARGNASHSEGGYYHSVYTATEASGASAHSEGYYTIASGDVSHAEGHSSISGGFASHAEGYWASASGYYSHAQNRSTRAYRKSQTAIGEFNKQDLGGGVNDPETRGDYAFIIGNGIDGDNRSNALGITWAGDGHIFLDVDSSADASTDATSGEDMDLFNNIRTLGWYSDIII